MVQLFQRRRSGSFEALLAPHIEHLYRLAYRFTGNRPDAEDLVQDLLVKLYPRRAELTGIDYLQPWLVRALYNLFIDAVRRAGRNPLATASSDDTLPELEAVPERDPEDLLLQQQLQQALLEAQCRPAQPDRPARHRGLHPAGARTAPGHAHRHSQVAPAPGAGTAARAAGDGTLRRAPAFSELGQTRNRTAQSSPFRRDGTRPGVFPRSTSWTVTTRNRCSMSCSTAVSRCRRARHCSATWPSAPAAARARERARAVQRALRALPLEPPEPGFAARALRAARAAQPDGMRRPRYGFAAGFASALAASLVGLAGRGAAAAAGRGRPEYRGYA
ncbi:MAG: RNA polymerase sigma factor [Chromatiales bacterium]|nr:RNA polymerase sigma factor [Chromatiales bacterium]